MRVKKINSVYKQQLDLEYPLFTEPNQSFTPRQIIDQFSRGELSAKSFEPSDDIDDSNYTDDNMVNNIVEFGDYFEASEFMHTTRVKSQKYDNRREEPAQEGSDKASEGSGKEEG